MSAAPGAAGAAGPLAQALGTPALRRLQVGWAAASLASWGLMVVFGLYAYEAGGTAAVGVAALVRMVPAGILAPLAGLAADRFSRRDVLVAASVARALLLAAIAVVAAAGAPIAVAMALAAIFTAVTTAINPAVAALLPDLVETPRQLAASNAILRAVEHGGFLVGSLASGVLVAVAGTDGAFAAIAAAALIPVVVWSLIRRDPPPPHRAEPLESTRHEIALGLRTVIADPPMRILVSLMGTSTLIEGALDVLVVVTALSLLDMGASGVGWLNAAWGLGGLAGGAVALQVLGRGRVSSAFAVASLLIGVPLVVLGLLPGVPLAVVLLTVLGTGYVTVEISGQTLLQRLVPDEMCARVFAVVESSFWLTTALGGILAVPLVDLLGDRGALVFCGACLPAAFLARWRALARFEDAAPVPAAEFAALRHVPLFAPVPMVAVENLARKVERVPLGVGETLFREGDAGDRFYVVAEGELAVLKAGVTVDHSPAGDYVGEMALLRDQPRNATITASRDSLLFALDRDDFITVVTGHQRSASAADVVMAARAANVPPLSAAPGDGRTATTRGSR